MQPDEVRSELATLWQAWLERVLAALLATGARSTEAQAAALGKLHLLRRFLRLQPVASLQLAEAASPQPASGAVQLCELLQCQAQLRQDGLAAAATAPLLQQLQQRLLRLAQACRHSDWTLASCVATGFARQCRELTLLGSFTGDTALAQQLVALEAQLLLWHAAARPPSAQQQALVQKQLLALTRGRAELCRLLQLPVVPGVEPALSLPPGAACAECAQLVALLQPALAAQAEVTETVMFACYRLAWVLQALGQCSVADVGLLLYQLLVRHWQQRAPLLPPEQQLLAAWLAQAEPPATGRAGAQQELQGLLGAALDCWPGNPRGAGLLAQHGEDAGAPDASKVLLPLPAAHSTAALEIRHLPEYLAASLSALLQVDAAWFDGRASWERCAALLQGELQLLEQGAAALRLSALEQLCSLLLGVYAQLDASLPQGPWPGALLWRVHHELVVMLDRAALWLEPLPAADTLAALRACLQQGEERCTALLRADAGATPRLRLACAMVAFGQQAGRLLGRPVRSTLDAPAELSAGLDAELLRALQEILRWLLLQHESSTEVRRSQRQPLATAITISLRPLDDAGIAVCVLETGMQGLPGGKAQQRLQRNLGPAVEALRCEDVPRLGRRIQCSLSPASLQRALDLRYRGERVLRQN